MRQRKERVWNIDVMMTGREEPDWATTAQLLQSELCNIYSKTARRK
jgi:hypothetical protein